MNVKVDFDRQVGRLALAVHRLFTGWTQDRNVRAARPGDDAWRMEPTAVDDGRQAALEVMLLMADADARWWNYEGAVALLDSAEAAVGRLPGEYELKRARWRRLRDVRRTRPHAWARRAA